MIIAGSLTNINAMMMMMTAMVVKKEERKTGCREILTRIFFIMQRSFHQLRKERDLYSTAAAADDTLTIL